MMKFTSLFSGFVFGSKLLILDKFVTKKKSNKGMSVSFTHTHTHRHVDCTEIKLLFLPFDRVYLLVSLEVYE
jgi:hypothetical protein